MRLLKQSQTIGIIVVTLPVTAVLAADHRPPQHLSQTGLYSGFASRTIDPANLSYSPQYPLWSDGARKQRWIYLPPGTYIDASDPNRWQFPIGTKIWKQFSWDHPVETRYLEKVSQGEWTFSSYAWTQDGSDAVLAPNAGIKDTYPLGQGRSHDIPSIKNCKECHEANSGISVFGGIRTQILGFSALQLSSDRDPNAPHADQLEPGQVLLPELVERGLVRNLPLALIQQPPRILASTPRGRAAIGYLHANCGTCHTPDHFLPGVVLGMNLRHSAWAKEEPAFKTAVGAHTRLFKIPGLPREETYRIEPGNPDHSAVVYRMGARGSKKQMPPIGTKIVDDEALDLVKQWILEGRK